jgi:hypothetical protein
MEREDEINLAYTDYVSTELKTDETTYISDAFVAGAKWADNHQRGNWRSVKDELPEWGEEVLVITITGDYGIGMMDDNPYINGWTVFNHRVSDNYIAFWMPLPEPPEEFAKIEDDKL